MMPAFDPVLDFATRLAATRDRSARMELLTQAMQPFGIKMFAYARFGGDNAVQAVETTYPDQWVTHYVESGYAETDIVTLEHRRSIVPFEWGQLLRRPDVTAAARQVFAEAAAFDIRHGFTVPIRMAGSSAMMSLVVEDRALLAEAAMAQRHAVQLMTLYYHDASCADAAAAAIVTLTPREREVLQWTARGKTGWEVGQILHLSERTVTFHAENAKTKLGAASRSHAAVKAIMQGLIAP